MAASQRILVVHKDIFRRFEHFFVLFQYTFYTPDVIIIFSRIRYHTTRNDDVRLYNNNNTLVLSYNCVFSTKSENAVRLKYNRLRVGTLLLYNNASAALE